MGVTANPLVRRLTEEMTARGMSAYALAKIAGVSMPTMTRVLAGEGYPSWETVQRLALALEISTDELRDPAITVEAYEPRGPGGRPIVQPVAE